MRTTVLTILATSALAGPALASDTPGPDLFFTHLMLTDVSVVGGFIEIEFEYEFENIGDEDIDLGGFSKVNTMDNVFLQTYLTDSMDASGLLYGASGGADLDPVILRPGDTYSGTFVSNTTQLPDPLDFGANVWLIIDIENTLEPIPLVANNRGVLLVPAPSAALALSAAAFGVLIPRRR